MQGPQHALRDGNERVDFPLMQVGTAEVEPASCLISLTVGAPANTVRCLNDPEINALSGQFTGGAQPGGTSTDDQDRVIIVIIRHDRHYPGVVILQKVLLSAVFYQHKGQ